MKVSETFGIALMFNVEYKTMMENSLKRF